MHPRNRFKQRKPDFGEYLQTRSSLEPHLIKRKRASEEGFTYTLDFSDPVALNELTCACLKHEFGLDVTIPPNHLVPTVPQRLNYVHWIEDLMAVCDDTGKFPTGPSITGIDIGTGASCIYPLLAVHLNNWKFIATEVDEKSFQCAKSNVLRNKMEDRISVILVSSNDPLLVGVVSESANYDFCICNPPFFKDQEDKTGLTGSRSGRRPMPSTLNTGNESETVTEGGEVKFVEKIVQDSLKLKTKIRWYSSMLGKKSSVKEIEKMLEKHQVPVKVTTEFSQGKTHRWAVAWSFYETLKTKVNWLSKGVKRLRPVSLLLKEFEPSSEGVTRAFNSVKKIFTELGIAYEVAEGDLYELKCIAMRNTWSHQRKRKRLKQRLKAAEERSKMSTSDEQLQSNVGDDASGREALLQQIEALSPPCNLKFTCLVSLEESVETMKDEAETKRHCHDYEYGGVAGGCSEATGNHHYGNHSVIVVSLEYQLEDGGGLIVGGENRDTLHQILQFIQNNINHVIL